MFSEWSQLVRERCFRHIRQITFAPTVRAAVIDVFRFMQFARDRAAIVGTREQAGKREIVLAALALISTGEHILYFVEKGKNRSGIVMAFIFDSLPPEEPKVKSILKHLFEIGTVDHNARFGPYRLT